jgi:hypothetical protein
MPVYLVWRGPPYAYAFRSDLCNAVQGCRPARIENDRDRLSRILRCLRRERPKSGDQHVRIFLNQLVRQWCQPLRISFGGTIHEAHVRSIAIAEFVQPLQQRFRQSRVLSGYQREEGNPVRLCRLLRPRRERRNGRRTAEHTKEFASPYVQLQAQEKAS